VSSKRHEPSDPVPADPQPARCGVAAKLAAIPKSSKTDAVLYALENELARIESAKPLAERLRPLQDRIAKRPATGPVIGIDASAIVAILSREPGCDTMIAVLERSESAVTSPIAVYETRPPSLHPWRPN
jgi:hypothetical protein